MKDLIIRKLAIEDAPAICEISVEGLGYNCDLNLVQRKIQNLDLKREAVFVCELDGKVAGYIHVEHYDTLYFETMANILALSVKKEFQKLGVGKALLLEAENWAKENGIKMMRLNSGINRTNAHGFYEHLGYVSEKDQKRFIKNLF
ncbi:Predicted N-acetyltransferase YhbS [Treponema bryantii]|uniref:Predicted N-acetyltransferase YhbS n=1 Tax=Treponema bryantii TaxID=163 RepID=A0A1H9DL48_9SPIR|nr:GNAT family N-acetyltransferase [Treponema bryantii]SEQ13438.1 Predicted N-acetyltransferase YhbS [Treponema bryantii]